MPPRTHLPTRLVTSTENHTCNLNGVLKCLLPAQHSGAVHNVSMPCKAEAAKGLSTSGSHQSTYSQFWACPSNVRSLCLYPHLCCNWTPCHLLRAGKVQALGPFTLCLATVETEWSWEGKRVLVLVVSSSLAILGSPGQSTLGNCHTVGACK